MKKIAAAFLFALMLAGPAGLGAAAESAVTADAAVRLEAGMKTGSFQITVNSGEPFAGCEFAAVGGDGVKITAVSYAAAGAMTTGPAEARGATHFSFYAADNRFSGAVTATVSFECGGDKNTSVLLYTAKIYTKSGAGVKTQLQTPDQLIEIRIAGKTNPIKPPKPPGPESGAPPSSGGAGGGVSRGGSDPAGDFSDPSESAGTDPPPAGSRPDETGGDPEGAPSGNHRGAVIVLSAALGVSLAVNSALGVLLYRAKKGGNGIGRSQ